MSLQMCRTTGQLGIIAVCLLGGWSGCTNERQRPEPTPPAVTASSQDRSQPASPPEPSPDAFLGATDAVEQKRPALDPVVLRDVRAASQAAFDRVVFEFETASVPGYRIAYAESPALRCGSGETVSVQGVQLIVRLSPAQAHTEAGTVTVKEQERHFTLPVLRELEVSCDFEGEVSWVLGLTARRPFRVSELSGPARLVVDIQH
jgi:hypothetical protein